MYLATLAPGLTFWDAGEFITAIHTFGIPHPPGTPLYVTAARAWTELLGAVPRALAANSFSALCTALAGAALASWLARAAGSMVIGVACALAAGAMTSVWSSATETEVYASSLLLAMCILLSAARAGATGERRWLVLCAYSMALAVPLHLSALVVSPAAIVLAGRGEHGEWRLGDAGILLGVAFASVAVGLASPQLLAAAVGGGLAVIVSQRGKRTEVAVAAFGAGLLALTALAIMLLRARNLPPLNEGIPESWSALWDVVGRRQYGSGGLWPRRAPLWLQLANFLEYADWQVAFSLAPRTSPAASRTACSIAWIVLGVLGASAHRRLHRRSWCAMLVLLLSSSLGLVLYLNFKAGASLGYGILPDSAPHEARERDYFFALAFWSWGAWCGWGAVELARRWLGDRAAPFGLLLAAAPVALNWSAMDRRRSADREAARDFAIALLQSTPHDGVLVAGGDNDAFPLWYLTRVEGARPDVFIVVLPLLGTAWMQQQIAAHDSLLPGSRLAADAAIRTIVERSEHSGRSVAFTPWGFDAVSALDSSLAAQTALHGVVRLHLPDQRLRELPWSTRIRSRVDTAATRSWLARIRLPPATARDSFAIDPTVGAIGSLLRCPAEALANLTGASRDSLASVCNPR